MKSLILYGSRVKLTNAHKLVTTQVNSPLETNQPKYYVRAKVFNGDADTALLRSKPAVGETVLNTIEIA